MISSHSLGAPPLALKFAPAPFGHAARERLDPKRPAARCDVRIADRPALARGRRHACVTQARGGELPRAGEDAYVARLSEAGAKDSDHPVGAAEDDGYPGVDTGGTRGLCGDLADRHPRLSRRQEEIPGEAERIEQVVAQAKLALIEGQGLGSDRVIGGEHAGESVCQPVTDEHPANHAVGEAWLVLGQPANPGRRVDRVEAVARDCEQFRVGQAAAGQDLRRAGRWIEPGDKWKQRLIGVVERHADQSKLRDRERIHSAGERLDHAPAEIGDRQPQLLRFPDVDGDARDLDPAVWGVGALFVQVAAVLVVHHGLERRGPEIERQQPGHRRAVSDPAGARRAAPPRTEPVRSARRAPLM